MMESESATRTTPLERLPAELIWAILSKLDCLKTLHRAVLSCRLLWRSFSKDSSRVATSVILNYLDSYDVRPEALAALQASSMPELTPSSMQEFYTSHLSKRHADRGAFLTFAQVAAVARLHSAVSRLADEFPQTYIPKLPTPTGDLCAFEPLELSPSEKGRVIRALYALEIFFNLFRKTSMSHVEEPEAMNEFLVSFAPWEIEQIVCAQEFLFLHVSPAFKNPTTHNVPGRRFENRPALWSFYAEVQTRFFLGLVALESIARAGTYNQQDDPLYHGRTPPIRRSLLSRALQHLDFEKALGDHEKDSVSSFENAQDYSTKVKPPFFDDPDEGPFTVWKEAHRLNQLRDSVYQRDHELQGRAYVMWSGHRLDSLGALHNPRQILTVPRKAHGERGVSSWRERSRRPVQWEDELVDGWWDPSEESSTTAQEW
ncbi:hypothetical protein F5Y13DRAFT_58077 [Hypoxylon sp. FL1857]|nr:hypothetical protein F5Y13DRAFT_58077 [Hypoxylon sp. FL1857]